MNWKRHVRAGKSALSGCLALSIMAIGCQSVEPAISTTALVVNPPPATGPAIASTSLSAIGITDTLRHIRQCLDTKMVIQVGDPVVGKLRCPPGAEMPAPKDAISSVGYPAAVIYAGMLNTADATGEKEFTDFVGRRFSFFARTIPLLPGNASGDIKSPYHNWLSPTSLDSCGAMGAAFVKARRANIGDELKVEIDRFEYFVSTKQYRLTDGTFARHRPYPDSVWADDMYMSIPFLAQMGALTNKSSYFDDAATQVKQISARLFVPSSGLYTHGWNPSAGDTQPHYYWGRANGWCAMAIVELLEVLPADHPARPELLKQLRDHARGIASVQGGSGLWHQMLDRPDSYPETSCSAMFTFAIARAVNRGWLDAGAYGPVAIAGWKGIASRIDSTGHVTGACEGTNYANDYSYYYTRKFTDDQHGYGPVLLAGGEMIRLLNNPQFHIQDDAGKPVQFTRGRDGGY